MSILKSFIFFHFSNLSKRIMTSHRNSLVAALTFIVSLLLLWTHLFHNAETVDEKVSGIEPLISVNVITPGIHFNLVKAAHTSRVLKVADLFPLQYSESENVITKSSIVWADFVTIPKERLRSKTLTLEPEVLKTMKLCPQSIVANLSLELAGADFDWCKKTLTLLGGKDKVGC